MKYLSFIVLILALSTGLMSSITSFSNLGMGKFGGKPAAYASGDTLVYVIRESNGTPTGVLKYYSSFDGGTTWNSSTLVPPQISQSLTGSPSLCYSPDEQLLVSQDYIFKSTDGGSTWQDPPYNSHATFENCPIVEKRDSTYYMINTVMPYPEDRQDEFVIPGTEEFAVPQLLSNVTQTPNNTPTFFTGSDVITGSVRCNEDIWIRQTTGANNGWPTFYGPVVTCGRVRCYPDGGTNYPANEIFLGGLIEHAPSLELPDLGVIDQDAIRVGPPNHDEDYIIYVEVTGSGYVAWWGIVHTPVSVFTDVWSGFPYGTDTPPEFRNNFTVRDTVWTMLPGGTCAGRAMRVCNKLWIKGQFTGNQTWMALDTLYIVGDITLSGTTPGTSPAGNTTDFVNLVSEKSIILKYGYKDPYDSTRVHPFCKPDSEPHKIYASLYALGDGQGNPRRDGVFTFEYQHPHGSIPATRINVPGIGDTLFDWIDLHRHHWPQSPEHPWPPDIDYPWYNPLWPEREPYLERGTIVQYGSVVQRRQGLLHRPYVDTEYPSNGIWNPPLDYCGGSSAPNPIDVPLWYNPDISVTLQTRNFPGASGSGIGYKKQQYADQRNTFSNSDGYLTKGFWRMGLRLSSFDLEDEFDPTAGLILSDYNTYYLLPQTRKTYAKSFARRGMVAAYSVNDMLVSALNDELTDISAATLEDGNITTSVVGNDNNIWVNQLAEAENGYLLTVKQISTVTGGVLHTFPDIAVSTKLNGLAVLSDGRVLLAYYENGVIRIRDISTGDESLLVDSWPLQDSSGPISCGEESRLYLLPSGDDHVEVFLWIKSQNPEQLINSGTLYHARANFPVGVNDPVLPPTPQVLVSLYPNPMHTELRLDTMSNEKIRPIYEIYNIKGQKIRTLFTGDLATKHSITWDGMDSANRQVGSGIYLIKAIVDNKVVQIRRICKY